MGDGAIEVDSINAIELSDITPTLARESGFAGVIDLLKTAKHGPGTNVYLVRFHYVSRRTRASKGETRSSRAAAEPRTKKPSSDPQRRRVIRMLRCLPEAVAVVQHSYLSLEVRKKRFGYFLDDHHGDGRIALTCRASPDLHDALQQIAPTQFHVPKYVGKKGWIGLWLDGTHTNWPAVDLALREAYALVAPKSLSRSG
jgi:predicted DNA-binding protein (MmcQ/YjbR family)